MIKNTQSRLSSSFEAICSKHHRDTQPQKLAILPGTKLQVTEPSCGGHQKTRQPPLCWRFLTEATLNHASPCGHSSLVSTSTFCITEDDWETRIVETVEQGSSGEKTRKQIFKTLTLWVLSSKTHLSSYPLLLTERQLESNSQQERIPKQQHTDPNCISTY